MLEFLKIKKSPPVDFSVLHTDMHSHLVPEIDDGSDSMETSLRLVRQMKELGYRKLITTPHVMTDLYPNSSETIREGARRLREAVKKKNLDITVLAAAEYLIDEGFEALMEKDDLLTIEKKYVLVEVSFISPPPGLHQTIFRLRTKGYLPILAHPERYLYWNRAKDFEKLKEMGCLFQINMLSLTGYYGDPILDTALLLLRKGWVDFLGSDLHHNRHMGLLQDAIGDKTVQRVLKNYRFKNMEL